MAVEKAITMLESFSKEKALNLAEEIRRRKRRIVELRTENRLSVLYHWGMSARKVKVRRDSMQAESQERSSESIGFHIELRNS